MNTAERIKVVYVVTSCRKDGPIQQTLNIIKNLDREIFDPILVTIYEERKNNSRLDDFITYAKHYFVPISKMDILLKRTSKMSIFLNKIKPDVVHTLGVFPDYLISSMKIQGHILTLRNYASYDYPDRYGKLKGKLLAKMQILAAKKSNIVVTCSKSLQKIYQDELNFNTECVQNGVDIKKYSPATERDKMRIREKMGFSKEDRIFVYSGQFIGRKNIPFMIDGFNLANTNSKFLLLGDGAGYYDIKEKYGKNKNLIFVGMVDNVLEYLAAGDIYVSASKSEGLPNGVLEAMAMGIPVLLSNIPQHKELVPNELDSGGLIFDINDINDYETKIRRFETLDIENIGNNARENMVDNFSDEVMSRKYQVLYERLATRKNEEFSK